MRKTCVQFVQSLGIVFALIPKCGAGGAWLYKFLPLLFRAFSTASLRAFLSVILVLFPIIHTTNNNNKFKLLNTSYY